MLQKSDMNNKRHMDFLNKKYFPKAKKYLNM